LKRLLKSFLLSPQFAAGRMLLRAVILAPLRGYVRHFPVLTGKPAVWKHVAGHLWWLESRVEANTFFGASLQVDARDDCGRFIYYFGLWEPPLTAWIQSHLKSGDCFVDVGANIGYFSVLASPLVGSTGRVVSIEAIPKTFSVLNRNLLANRLNNTRSLNIAVWDKEEVLTFFVPSDIISGVSTVMPERVKKRETLAQEDVLSVPCCVSAAPLSALLSKDEIKAARIIKIDVEGAEEQVTLGLGSILQSGRSDLEVVMEVSTRAFDNIISFFRHHGFFPYHMPNDYSIVSYLAGRPPAQVKLLRLQAPPKGAFDVDVIFSKIDASFLC
jgi:FkbM family methyltransferase